MSLAYLRPRAVRPSTLFLALIVAGCADEPAPLSPPQTVAPSIFMAQAIEDQLAELVPDGGLRNSAHRRLRNIRRQLGRGEDEAAQEMMFELVSWLVEREGNGQLLDPNDGNPPTTQEALTAVIGDLFELVSLSPPTVPPEALEPGGTVAIIDENGGSVAPDVPVVGVSVPAGAFDGPTLVWIAPLPPNVPPLPTGLTQFLPYYEIDASADPNVDVTIGICYFDDPPDPGGVPVGFPTSRLRIAHPDPSNPSQLEILPVAPTPPFLDCAASISPSRASVFPLLDWATAKIGSALSRWVGRGSSAALMVHRGLGGTVRSFSPFAVVDIQSGGSIVLVSGDDQTAPNGTTLPNPFVVEVRDAVNLPLAGVTVDFTIQNIYGPGLDGTFSPTSAVTNGSGQAQTTWTLSDEGEANLGAASVSGFAAGGRGVRACGTFVGSSLNAFVQSADPVTGVVVVNGGDWRRPIGHTIFRAPFSFDWGDGTVTQSFFPATHTYANTTQNYPVTVTATYCDGTTDNRTVTVPFTTAPIQINPPHLSVHSHFPRTTTLEWTAVPGAAKYRVEIQFCGTPPITTSCPGGWSPYPLVETTSLQYTFDFVGAQPGRWRVWAVDPQDVEGPKSTWWIFVYTI